ncbi:hypothetical protein GCM10011348_17110 [Marinobacterium nitratireducens]|uniref:Transglutaminase-like domain-containing protein n=1 Tax=Marinobacterium nitratireducens TaxID=518897 RepID=A0A918DQV1_9GAMM|nr:transglutaminase-like cysteine peptidase [Marinobacterium nitratireducens]GGO80442.1 hypothetical protein GCM10011348_17110 [Marinobacterium nitratireducens]
MEKPDDIHSLSPFERRAVAESYKLLAEAQEIEDRRNRSWYKDHGVFRAVIAGIIAAGLLSAWAVEYFSPILETRTRIAELNAIDLNSKYTQLKSDFIKVSSERDSALSLQKNEIMQQLTIRSNVELLTKNLNSALLEMDQLRREIPHNSNSDPLFLEKLNNFSVRLEEISQSVQSNRKEIARVSVFSETTELANLDSNQETNGTTSTYVPIDQNTYIEDEKLFFSFFCAECLLNFETDYFSQNKQKILAYAEKSMKGDTGKLVAEIGNLLSNEEKYSIDEKLNHVNELWNTLRIVPDEDIDKWYDPIDMIYRGGGDCEDFALAKYVTLRALGVENDYLLIAYMKDTKINEAVMVLLYSKSKFTNGDYEVLDGRSNSIEALTDRQDLTPVYMFNSEYLYLAAGKQSIRKVGSSGQISKWTEYLSARATYYKNDTLTKP